MDGGYSIAEIGAFRRVRRMRDFYQAAEVVGLNDFTNVLGWLDRCIAHPPSQRDLKIPPRE